MQSVQTDCSVRPDVLIFPVVSGISGSFCLGLVLGSSFLRLYGFCVILAEQQALVFVQFLLAAVQVKCHSSQRTSGAYFLAAGLLVPGSELLIHNVGINPTRAGILTVLRAMGGNLTVLNERVCAGEPVADLLVSASSLHGTTIEGNLIPALIDEIPMIAVMAAFANGQTVIRDAAELKVKESDRIATVTAGLRAMGCDITPTDDGMIIRGGKTLHGAEIDSYLDHRIAMSFAVAALAADGVTSIKDADCVKISYPNFYDDLLGLAK